MGSKYRQVEKQFGKPMRVILRQMYEKYGHEQAPQDLIAAELGCSQPTLSLWIKQARLRRKLVLIEDES